MAPLEQSIPVNRTLSSEFRFLRLIPRLSDILQATKSWGSLGTRLPLPLKSGDEATASSEVWGRGYRFLWSLGTRLPLPLKSGDEATASSEVWGRGYHFLWSLGTRLPLPLIVYWLGHDNCNHQWNLQFYYIFNPLHPIAHVCARTFSVPLHPIAPVCTR